MTTQPTTDRAATDRQRWRASESKRKRERYATDPEFRERTLASSKGWKVRNRDKCTAYMRSYRARRRAEARAS